MPRTTTAYRVNLACEVANAATSQALLDAVCGPGEFDLIGSWALKYTPADNPGEHTHTVAAQPVTVAQYASIAAGAAAAGLAHMVEAIWYVEPGGEPYQEELELEQTLWQELGIVPLEEA